MGGREAALPVRDFKFRAEREQMLPLSEGALEQIGVVRHGHAPETTTTDIGRKVNSPQQTAAFTRTGIANRKCRGLPCAQST